MNITDRFTISDLNDAICVNGVHPIIHDIMHSLKDRGILANARLITNVSEKETWVFSW